jgi:hypothetical protein
MYVDDDKIEGLLKEFLALKAQIEAVKSGRRSAAR